VRTTRNGRGGGRRGLDVHRGRGGHDVRAGRARGKFGWDGYNRQNPWASERGCANGRSALTGGAHC
jgi:hypothetical protein